MTRTKRQTLTCIAIGIAALSLGKCTHPAQAARPDGELEISIVDSETGRPVPARIHLRDGRGRHVSPRGWGLAPLGDHVYIDGSAKLSLNRGQYVFDLDAGIEYRPQAGHFEIVRHALDSKRIEVRRFAKLHEEGWYAGDLDVLRNPADMVVPMQAEQLAYLPTVGMTLDDRGSWKPAIATRRKPTSDVADEPTSLRGPFAGLYTTPGNRLLFFRERDPLEPIDATKSTSSVDLIESARAPGNLHVVAVSPFERSFPVWLASGKLDAVLLLNRHSLREGVVDNEAGGRPRDKSLYPSNSGNPRWAETIYHHALNAGLRLPPAAGSGSGANDSPIGTNRVYVHCGDGFSPESWWLGLAAGNVVITNGPLIRPFVEGHLPGHVFRIEDGEELELLVALNLATRTPISYLEIVKNGVAEQQVEIASLAKSGGKLPPVKFVESGWFLIRAVTNNAEKYELASTGPYYVEKNGEPRISRRSVQFFLDWLDEEEVRASPTERPTFAEAREFWRMRLEHANAE